MTRKTIILLMLLTFLIVSCNNRAGKANLTDTQIDTTKSFKVDNLWLTPKESFEFNSLGKSTTDTLVFVICSDFAFFPFGKISDKSSLSNSLLKHFTITNCKRDTFTNIMMPDDTSDNYFQWSESIELELGNNKLNLFLDNDPEASTHSYIRSGSINNSEVELLDGIKTGISAADFFSKFFEYFPMELTEKYNVIKLESCVTSLTHIYTFNNGELKSITFK